MNTVALWIAGVILVIAVATLVLALAVRREIVQRVRENVDWLLKISFLDFVQLIIFLKPLKKHTRPVGLVLWLVLAYIVGRYMIVMRPALSEIPGPYIPMIGYVYCVSALYIMSLVLAATARNDN